MAWSYWASGVWCAFLISAIVVYGRRGLWAVLRRAVGFMALRLCSFHLHRVALARRRRSMQAVFLQRILALILFGFSGWLAGSAPSSQGILMSKLFARFLKDKSGATAIEYGLIAAGISIAIITVVNGLGTNLNTKLSDINSSLK